MDVELILLCIMQTYRFLLFVQIKRLGKDHNCATTKLTVGKMDTEGWCADRLANWLKKNPTKGPSDCKEKLE
jgi:hypothetical protein